MTPPSPLVLVVEDDADTADMLSEMLGLAGYRVAVARTLDDAASALSSARYAAAVLDLTLSGSPLEELTARLSLANANAGTPLVVYSARAPEALLRAGQQLRATAVLQKPASMERILAAVALAVETGAR